VSRFNRERLILLIAHFFFFLNFSELILLPKYFQHIGISPSKIGLLMGAFSISVITALPMAGIISERIPRKTLFIAGAALMALPGAWYVFFSDRLSALFLLRVLQGIGFSCAFGIIGAMVAQGADTAERKYLLGILTLVGISTHALGPVLGEYLIGRYGFHVFFLSATVLGMVASGLGFLLPSHVLGSFQRIHSMKFIPWISASSVVLGVIFGSVAVFLPPYLLTRGVMNSSFFFIPFVFGSLFMWTIIYPLIRAWPETIVRIASSVLLVLLLACIHMVDAMYLFVFLSLLFGIGYGYLYPCLNACLIEANPASEGLANALFVWCFNVGMLIASVGFGFLCEKAGYETAFRIIAFLGFICMIVTGLWGRKRTVSQEI
jgi:MFS family permease